MKLNAVGHPDFIHLRQPLSSNATTQSTNNRKTETLSRFTQDMDEEDARRQFMIKRGCNKSFLQELNDQEFEACYIFKHKCSHEAITAINGGSKLGMVAPSCTGISCLDKWGHEGKYHFVRGSFDNLRDPPLQPRLMVQCVKKLIFFCGE